MVLFSTMASLRSYTGIRRGYAANTEEPKTPGQPKKTEDVDPPVTPHEWYTIQKAR